MNYVPHILLDDLASITNGDACGKEDGGDGLSEEESNVRAQAVAAKEGQRALAGLSGEVRCCADGIMSPPASRP